jgi:hypothetical protein
MSDPIQEFDDADEIISPEDQKDIAAEIERVANENRIHVTEEALAYVPQKNGMLFPLLINGLGLALLIIGSLTLFLVFQSQEDALRSTVQLETTTESLLIAEIRREAEAALSEKDEEIRRIEEQMAALSAERAALAQDMESQVADREAELRQQLEAELEVERQRLQALNLSEEQIAAAIAQFEAEKNQEFEAELNRFRQEAIAERERVERELAAREAEFSSNLAQASQERDSMARENEARMAELAQEMEAQRAAGQAELDAAAQELAALSQRREREALLRGQISGLYRAVSQSLAAENNADVRNRLQSLRSILNSDQATQIDAIREQRPIDLFIISAIEELVTLREASEESGDAAGTVAAEALEEAMAEIDELSALREELQAIVEELETELTDLLADQEQAAEREETLQADLEMALSDIQRLQALLVAAEADDTTEELVELRELAQQIRTAQAQYTEILTTGTDGDRLIAARTQLQELLTTSAMATLFPDFNDLISRFEPLYVAGGRENALVDAADILIDVGMLNSPDQRRDAVASLLAATTEPAMQEFLAELEELLLLQ